MTKTITVSLPHKLTQAAVRARIDATLADARRQYPQYAAGLQERWEGNRLEFKVTAMGQSVTGRADVQPDIVHIHIDLPILLAMLADKIRPRIEAECRKMLAGPKPPGR